MTFDRHGGTTNVVTVTTSKNTTYIGTKLLTTVIRDLLSTVVLDQYTVEKGPVFLTQKSRILYKRPLGVYITKSEF